MRLRAAISLLALCGVAEAQTTYIPFNPRGAAAALHCGTGNIEDCGTVTIAFDPNDAECGDVTCTVDSTPFDSLRSESFAVDSDKHLVAGQDGGSVDRPIWHTAHANFGNNAYIEWDSGDDAETDNFGTAQGLPVTIMYVMRWQTTSAARSLFWGSNSFRLSEEAGTNQIKTRWATGSDFTSTNTISTSTTHVIALVLTATSSKIRIDGAEDASGALTQSGTIPHISLLSSSTGASTLDGELGYFIMFDEELTGSNLTGAECILSNERGGSVSGC